MLICLKMAIFNPQSVAALALLSFPQLIFALKEESRVIRDTAMTLRAQTIGANEIGNLYRLWSARSPNEAIELQAQVHVNGCVSTKIYNHHASLWQGSNLREGVAENHFKELRALTLTGEQQTCENRIFYEEHGGFEPKAIRIRCDKGLIEELRKCVTLDAPRDAVELTDVAANLLNIVADYGLKSLSPINVELDTEANIGGLAQGRIKIFVNKSIISTYYYMPNSVRDWNRGYLTLKSDDTNHLRIKFRPDRSSKLTEINYLGKGHYNVLNRVHEFSGKQLELDPSTVSTLDRFIT